MKITFVNTRREIYPPLGLCYLSSYIKSKLPSVQTSLIELKVGESPRVAASKVLQSKPDVVGITTYTVGYYDIIRLCEAIKSARPDVQIWLGGPHITSLPSTLPLYADLAVIGEGEETLLELCQQWEVNGLVPPDSLPTIRGICYRKDGTITLTERRELIRNIDSIPPPDLSILDMKWYTKSKKFLVMKGYFKGFVILTSRGCPYDCRFCQAAVQWGKCRYHTAERVVSEIEGLRNKYPKITAINIIDDLFIGSRKRLRKIVELLREKNLHKNIVFNINGRANLIDEEVLELLKSINVVQISYGFESASERILDFLKRGSVTVTNNWNAAKLTNQFGIGVGGQFMIGTPGETEEDIKETIHFIRSNKMSHAHLSVTTPLPGTELWSICKQKGLVSDDMDWRTLDFGIPNNPRLIYINEHTVPKEKFLPLLREAQEACNLWNPPQTLRDYIGYLGYLSFGEFVRKGFKKILSILR